MAGNQTDTARRHNESNHDGDPEVLHARIAAHGFHLTARCPPDNYAMTADHCAKWNENIIAKLGFLKSLTAIR